MQKEGARLVSKKKEDARLVNLGAADMRISRLHGTQQTDQRDLRQHWAIFPAACSSSSHH